MTVSTATITQVAASTMNVTNNYQKLGNTILTLMNIATGSITASTSTTTTGAFVKTGLLATITPKSTSSRILIIANLGRMATTTSSVVLATVERNAVDLSAGSGFQEWDNNGAGGAPGTITYLDSPASTSPLTYEVYMRGSAGTTTMNDTNITASIMAIEIL